MVKAYIHPYVCPHLHLLLKSLIQLQLLLDEVVGKTPEVEADVNLRVLEEVAEDDHLIDPSPNHVPLREVEDEGIHRLRRNHVLISNLVSVLGVQDASMTAPRTERGLTVLRIVDHQVETKEVVYLAAHREESSQNVFYLRKAIASLVQRVDTFTP